MTGKIFLNYRRADAEAWADRLFERLIKQFPRDHVFMDIDGNIPFGFSWAKWLDQQVAACDLMIVLIGRTWVSEFQTRAQAGERDYVRVEIESALVRNVPVVPVLLADAATPRSSELPESLRPLLALQAARLQRLSFDMDAEMLMAGVVRSIALARGETAEWVKKPAQQTWMGLELAPTAAPKVGDVLRDIDIGPEMVVVPAGEFVMGSNDADDERPPHKVSIAKPFVVGRYPITFDEWDAALAAGGVKHKPETSWGRGRQPVMNVSWEDAKAYAAWLSQKSGKAYRLLSEAEWEYCCRAGTTTQYAFGESIAKQQAQFLEGSTVEVGSFQPNAFGLYDMHGNVWEWCEDTWHPNYQGAPSNGSVWMGGDTSSRILRGGSWVSQPDNLRSADRGRHPPGYRRLDVSFRVARTL
jgi:formylglycine-generating enzyme required for sulfatase activity